MMRKGSSSWGAISAAGLLLVLLALSSSPAGASNDLGRLRTAAGHAGILRLRGGVSKYYNHTAPPRRAGIFEDTGGLPPVTISDHLPHIITLPVPLGAGRQQDIETRAPLRCLAQRLWSWERQRQRMMEGHASARSSIHPWRRLVEILSFSASLEVSMNTCFGQGFVRARMPVLSHAGDAIVMR